MIFCVFKKTEHFSFRPPLDVDTELIEKGDGHNFGNLLVGALRPFWLASLLDEKQIKETVNDFLSYNAKSFRYNKKTLSKALGKKPSPSITSSKLGNWFK